MTGPVGIPARLDRRKFYTCWSGPRCQSVVKIDASDMAAVLMGTADAQAVDRVNEAVRDANEEHGRFSMWTGRESIEVRLPAIKEAIQLWRTKHPEEA